MNDMMTWEEFVKKLTNMAMKSMTISLVKKLFGKDWNADSTYNEERGDNFLSIQHSLGVKILNPNGCYILYDIEKI